MVNLSDKQISEFWHRSYASVDGLWFMKVEEKYGFDIALDIDNEVWKVIPKVQARTLKAMTGANDGFKGLIACLKTKLGFEGFEFNCENPDSNKFRVIITKCPWHDRMVRSGREILSGKVGTRICCTEYGVWAREFGENLCFEIRNQICEGSDVCILQFYQLQ